MTEPITVVVPQGQEANALAGFVGLTEQPTKECPVKWTRQTLTPHRSNNCQRCGWTGRVPLQSGDRVRFAMACDVCDGTGMGTLDGKRESWMACGECIGRSPDGITVGLLPLLRDGQPAEGEVIALAHRRDVAVGTISGKRAFKLSGLGYVCLAPDAFDSLAGCSWVLLWKEKTDG